MKTEITIRNDHIDALQAVDLRLLGVNHGTIDPKWRQFRVKGCEDEDYEALLVATKNLDAGHGDIFAVEPTGFARSQDKELMLASIVGADVPEIPVSEMSYSMRRGIGVVLEAGRMHRRFNNLAYAAAHTMLREVPVRRAETTTEAWEALQATSRWRSIDEKREALRHLRHKDMLACLGDAALEMMTARRLEDGADRPILLFATGKFHPPRLGFYLRAARIPFTTNI